MDEREVQTANIIPDLKAIRQYRWESDIEFHRFQKKVGNDYHSYFEELPNSDRGAYVLKPKFYPEKNIKSI